MGSRGDGSSEKHGVGLLQNKNGRGGVIRAFSIYFIQTFDIKIKHSTSMQKVTQSKVNTDEKDQGQIWKGGGVAK